MGRRGNSGTSGARSFKASRPVTRVKADFPQKHPIQSLCYTHSKCTGHLPVSAAGCSESCCPVIRCRQTCWELWSLAWSMLREKNTEETSGLAQRRWQEPPQTGGPMCGTHTRLFWFCILSRLPSGWTKD